MAKPPRPRKLPQRKPSRRLPHRQQKKKRKKRRSRLRQQHRSLQPVLRRRNHQKTKRPAPPHSSAKSPVSTVSASRRFPAPALAAASPSRTSWPSSSALLRRR